MDIPEKGFYYHYKHDPSCGFNDHVYEVVGIGHHTEMKDSDDALHVVYRPLYEAYVYTHGKMFDIRPVTGPDGFMTPKMDGGKTIQRFRKIEDPELIAKLAELRDAMYSPR